MYKTELITVPSSKEHDIMRNFGCLVGIRLPINADLTVQVRRIFKLFPTVYKNEHTFYNTVYRRIVKMRLTGNAFSLDSEYDILRDTAALICRRNPYARLKPTALDLCKMCGYDGTQANQFYQKVKKHFQRHPYASPTNR